MLGQSLYEQTAVEALVDDVVQQYHRLTGLVRHSVVHQTEVILRVQHVQVFYHLLIRNIALTEGCCLVEDAQSVTHTTVGLLGDDGQRLLLILYALLLGNVLQVVDGIGYRHTLEVVNLATTENGGQYLVLLRSSQDEDDVCWRFLQCLQESVKGCRREHVHLVNDKDLILAQLRRDARLLHQRLDVLYRVVRCGIELKDVQRSLFVERLTRLTFVARLAVTRRVLAVDGLGKDTRTGRLSHTTRPAKQVGMGQFARLHGILQRRRQSSLSHHRVKRHRAVFSGRNNVLHKSRFGFRLQK